MAKRPATNPTLFAATGLERDAPRPLAEPPRLKFGVIAFALAGLAFALFTIAFSIFVHVPPTAPDAARDVTLLFFVAVFLVIAPLMELTGIVLGIASLFRAGDLKILGFVSVILNILLLAGGLVLGTIMVASIGGSQ
ncbi:MAG TPA: hypothetical protein VFB68_10385 [Xanthobacteraceae bacterium]|nr:hypothetical protein [Xanthobacteraceae bacterium]